MDDRAASPVGTGMRAPRERQFARTDGRLRKIFAPDEVADRDREADALRAATGVGVPTLFDSGVDPISGRPWFEIAWTGDVDLRMHVGTAGPLASSEVLRIALATAHVLERIHAAGIVHGDVKPANLVLDGSDVTLVDWEHATTGDSAGIDQRDGLAAHFTGGTHGYAPPEAYLGAARTASFDLYGLGAMLHFALTGFAPPRHASGAFDARLLLRLRPTLPRGLLTPILGLLQHDEAQRPPASELVAAFTEAIPDKDALELALLAGDDVAVPEALTDDEAKLLAQRIAWRKRLERLLQGIAITPDELPAPARVTGAHRFCRATWLCSSFVPRMRAARDRLERARVRLPELFRSLPGEVQRLRQQLDYGEARQLALLSLDLCHVVSLLVLPDREAPQLVDATGHALQSAIRAIEAGELRLRTLLDGLESAEADLDFDAASRALAELFESFSGTNRNTAKIRDRHQRYVWLLERLVAGKEGIDEAVATIQKSGRTPHALRDLIDRVRNALDAESTEPHRSLNLCGRLLSELDQGWPKLQLGPAIADLTEMRRALSQRAAGLVKSMSDRLLADPVPLRPLLRELVEVDRILLLDCLVDTEASTRGALLDRLDKLRLRVEELSDQHRRLARGAREQLEQGRLTTALYDLERALEASVEDEGIGAEESIRRELEKVRKLRSDVRDATRRNLELAEAYEKLGSEDKSLDVRMNILAQREHVLSFLLENGARPFRARYQRELHELRILRLQEQAGDAERRYRDAGRPQHRLSVAHSMQSLINAEAEYAVKLGEVDSSGRLDLLRARWNDYVARAERDVVDQREAHERARFGRRLRILAFAAFAAVLSALTIFVLTRDHDVDARAIAEAKSIKDLEDLRDRTENPELRDALLGLVAAMRSTGEARTRSMQDFAAATARLEDRELAASLETRANQLLDEK
ncbi:MAG: hypothetical protein KDC95_18930 [Planctomycetes bacterium]|nr:hypothetical protein [Planctomycetota bacterium]